MIDSIEDMESDLITLNNILKQPDLDEIEKSQILWDKRRLEATIKTAKESEEK